MQSHILYFVGIFKGYCMEGTCRGVYVVHGISDLEMLCLLSCTQ
jgi:hypothetical protein